MDDGLAAVFDHDKSSGNNSGAFCCLILTVLQLLQLFLEGIDILAAHEDIDSRSHGSQDSGILISLMEDVAARYFLSQEGDVDVSTVIVVIDAGKLTDADLIGNHQRFGKFPDEVVDPAGAV